MHTLDISRYYVLKRTKQKQYFYKESFALFSGNAFRLEEYKGNISSHGYNVRLYRRHMCEEKIRRIAYRTYGSSFQDFK